MTTPKSTASAVASIHRKTFASRADYAKFALTAEAPRHSVTLSTNGDDDMAQLLGLTKGEALFSDDLVQLRRAAVAWTVNGFEIFVDKASNHPGCHYFPDGWAIRAKANVPAWFLEDVFKYIHRTPSLATPIAEVEERALDDLCENNGGGHPLFFVDKEVQYDLEYLDEVIADLGEHKGWA